MNKSLNFIFVVFCLLALLQSAAAKKKGDKNDKDDDKKKFPDLKFTQSVAAVSGSVQLGKYRKSTSSGAGASQALGTGKTDTAETKTIAAEATKPRLSLTKVFTEAKVNSEKKKTKDK